jgi:UDP-N-acetylglucosamine--N-acetylmuramyl-(pentapeptide) pyrophosphoryl-undecaprenol N-acetylglucosamine transferase
MSKRILIAGGGTGGHIFPAIAIAQEMKKQLPDASFLFVGAKGKMEMEKIPQAGFEIEGLDIAGFNRSSLIKNMALPFKLIKSFVQVRRIIKNFKPDAVIGVGGYSTYPVLRWAQVKGIPTFIHEANAFAGKSNRLLADKVAKVFTGTDGMETFFPKEKIVVTGNPVRQSILEVQQHSLETFGFSKGKCTLLVIGGSLGALSVNHAIAAGLERLLQQDIRIIWQTGKPYVATAKKLIEGKTGVWVNDFITDMGAAYSAADMIVSRAGAMSVAEISLVAKPTIFVPYPFAAEDHQTSNAMNLVSKEAALIVKDQEVKDRLIDMIIDLSNDEEKRKQMGANLFSIGVADADKRIVKEIIKVIGA